ncbi:MAG: hypothetical protein Q4A78_00465 [Peptostreptococcaceae bacterium]|nr:hypothetical protein [Peptostreptococcaceae bacterium]
MRKKIQLSILLMLILWIAGSGAVFAEQEGRGALRGETASPRRERLRAAKSGEQEMLNNGGEFLRVGDKVYFRKFRFDEDSSIADWGHHRTNPYSKNLRSDFGYWDVKGKKFHKVFEDGGYGPIFYLNGRFYLQERSENREGSRVYSVDINGKKKKPLGEGKVAGVDAATGSVVFQSSSKLSVYRGGALRKELDVNYNLLCEFADGQMIYGSAEPDTGGNGGILLRSIDMKTLGEPRLLGETLTDEENEGRTFYFMQVVSSKQAEGKLWLCVEHREGSGMFLSKGEVYSLDPKKAGSLRRAAVYEDLMEDRVPGFAVKNGKVKFYDILPGEVKEKEGNLYFNASDQPSKQIDKHRIYKNDYPNRDEDLFFNIETAERVGDEIYFVRNKERFYYAFGSRHYYYQLVNTEYFSYNIRTGKLHSLFGRLHNDAPLSALIWVSKDKKDENRLLFEQAELVRKSDDEDKKFFYGISDEDITGEGVMVSRTHHLAQTAKLSPKLTFEYLMLGKNGKPVAVKDGGLKEFKEIMKNRRKAAVSFRKDENGSGYLAPREAEDWKDKVFAQLYFDESGETVLRIVEIEMP